MDFLPFYIYWVLGGDLSSHFARCGSNSAGDTGICISEWSCTAIAKGINIGSCEIEQSEDICCKIPPLNVSVEIKPSTLLQENKFDKGEAKSTRNSSDTLQTEDSSIRSVKNHISLPPVDKNFPLRSWNIFAPIVNHRKPVVEEATHNMRVPVEVEATHNMRIPVEVEVTHNMRIPVEAEVKQNMRIPVEVEASNNTRSPVEIEVNQNMRSPVEVKANNDRSPVEVEVNQNMGIPAEAEVNHNMRFPVEQVKDFNLRRPILPNESHDLRWPVLDECTHDLRKPFPGYNTESYTTKAVNMAKVDAPNSKENAMSNIDNFERFYKYPLDKISGENNDYVRCVENLFSTNKKSNISNPYMQAETADEKLYKKMLDTSSEVCGRPYTAATAKLVGGRNSAYLQWPWMVSVRQRYRNRIRHKCGGTLLNNLWVITAAHCVDLVPKWNFILRLGDHNLNKDDEPHVYVVRYIDRIVKHQKFNPNSYENDIALLLMNSPVELRPNIVPICLPKKIGEIVGRTSIVLGWGRVKEDGYLSGSLQELNLPVLSNRQCEEMYGEVGPQEEIKDVFLCAGTAEGGSDTCDGDSGGPMLILDSENKWSLIGLVSWGKVCGAPYQPGVYTRITKYVDWIDGILACHILKKEFE